MSEPTLLPCPCCGDASVQLVGDSSTDWYCVVCCGCDLRTGLYDTAAEAAAAWDCRPVAWRIGPLIPALGLATLPGCAGPDALLVGAAVLAPLWVVAVAARLRGRWAAEDAARAESAREFAEAGRKLRESIKAFKASIERARQRGRA